MSSDASQVPPLFGADFRRMLQELFLWRRDVRRFLADPVPAGLIEDLIGCATLAPSVGNSQPWRFVAVETEAARRAVRDNFNRCNAAALATYEGERAARYARLKLAGLVEAPVHLAVFNDETTLAGAGLGRHTMPESLDYSVVAAIHTLWLAARTQGLGVGWVSILDPLDISAALQVPADWKLIAYLCIGFPQEEHLDPELERHGWQDRLAETGILHRR